MRLVKYECGCVGFAPDTHQEVYDEQSGPVIIEDCRGSEDGRDLGCSRSPGTEAKPYKEMNILAVNEYVARLSSLISDGYSLRRLQSIVVPPKVMQRLKDVELLSHDHRGGGCGGD